MTMSAMPYERTAEILDPVRDALLLRIPRSLTEKFTCPNCGSGEYLYNAYELRNACCGNCGQAIKWEN